MGHRHTDTQREAICTPFQCRTNSVSRGSGFIAELAVNGQKKCLLITCHHVLPSLSDARKSDIYFGRVGTSDKGTKINGQELFQSQFFKTDAEDVSKLGVVASVP